MKVILDVDKLTYDTLSMIGQDYGLTDSFDAYSTEDIEKYGDIVVNKLEEDTEQFKEQLIVNILEEFKNN